MQFIEIQHTHIPAIGLGTWKLRGEECRRTVRQALELGYRHLDTAQMYENEAEVGGALRESEVARSSVFLTTKVSQDNLRPEDVQRSTDASLRRLNTEYVDLLLIHWPVPDVPVEKTLDAMMHLKEGGKVRHIGVSNFTPELLRRALEHTTLLCNQVEYHPFLDQSELIRIVREHDMMLTAYSPLAQGGLHDNPVLKRIGKKHGKSPEQITLRWFIQQPHVAAIPKSASKEHLQSNIDVFDFELTDEEMSRIHELARGERLVDPDKAPWQENSAS